MFVTMQQPDCNLRTQGLIRMAIRLGAKPPKNPTQNYKEFVKVRLESKQKQNTEEQESKEYILRRLQSKVLKRKEGRIKKRQKKKLN